MEFQSANNSPENVNNHDSNISTESEPEVDPSNAADQELRTYIIIVNDDGSLTLDPNGQLSEDSDPQTVFPVHLPVNKMKSVDCPLPGATPLQGSSRIRKSKPQAVLYSGENDNMYEIVPENQPNFSGFNADQNVVNGTSVIGGVVNPTLPSNVPPTTNVVSGGAPPQTAIDIAQLGPQEMAIIETVLQSDSAREMRELLEMGNFAFPTPETTNPPSVVISGNHLWDHSYSAVPHSPPSSSSVSIQHPSIEPSSSEQVDGRVPTKKPIVPVNQPTKSIFKVTFNNSSVEQGPASTPQTTPSVSLPSVSAINPTTQSNRRTSEGDPGANIRRSQRQQDRIERQEAERIMAENQQMLQREKELMMENNGVVVNPPKPETPPPTTSLVSKVIVLSPPFEPVDTDSISVQSISPIKTPTDDPLRSDRRPTRHRKLPAHLADPNYVRLEDETKILIKETVVSKSDETHSTEALVIAHAEGEEEEKEISSAEDDDDEDYAADEDVGEDDPNKLWCICRQPHNNRFMICCDKCDDWFHGKCVGVTKIQATQWEQRNVQWHCPKCKKTLKPQTPSSLKRKHPGRPSGSGVRRESETSVSTESPQSRVDKSAHLKKQFKGQPVTHTPKRKDLLQKPGPRRIEQPMRSRQASTSEDSLAGKTDCIICGKKARPSSVYCNDDCVRQHALNMSRQKDNPTITIPTNATPTSATPATLITPPLSGGSQQKLKRLNSLKTDQDKAKEEPFFAFHVIQTGAAKSTEVVPPRQKELSSQKSQSQTTSLTSTSPISATLPPKPSQSPTKMTTPNQANHQHSGIKTNSSGSSSSSSGGKRPAAPKEGSEKHVKKRDVATKDVFGGAKTSDHRRSSSISSSEKSTTKEKKKVKESPKDLEKEKDALYGRDGESLVKENIRKAIRETLKTRLKDVSEEEKASYPAGNTPEYIAEKLEEELTSLYGGANNAKCRSKYRSIYFNLKDPKNSLFREILQGNILPKTLVKMGAPEMASAELAEWRNKENQKNLEMIKRAELDKLAEAKKQELLDKGADVDAVVVAEEQTRKLDIADVIGTKDSKETSEKVEGGDNNSEKSAPKTHSSHHRKDKKRDKDSKDKHRDSKYRHSTSSSSKDKEKRSEKHRHKSRDESKSKEAEGDKDIVVKEKTSSSSSSGNKDKSKSSVDKDQIRKDRDSRDKDNRRDSTSGTKRAGSRDEKRDKDSKILKHTDSSDKLDVKILHTQEESGSNEESLQGTPIYSSSESSSNQFGTDSSSSLINKQDEPSKYVMRYSTDSEQEMPSSTIKTPDFTDDKKEKPIFRTKLVMHELGHFGAGVYNVSHNHLEGVIFPESPVPIVGRISPETVWDYIDKMKKTKEVIVLRLAPDTPADAGGYMTFFTYLSSRGRLGVMGGLISPLKDVYLVPLDKHSPVNRALLPFRGPGLRKDRNHCLLAVVTRHIVQIPPVVPVAKRKTSNPSPTLSPLTMPAKKKKVSDSSSKPGTSGLPSKKLPPSPLSNSGSSRLISTPDSFAVPMRKSITEGLSGTSTKGEEEEKRTTDESTTKLPEDELNKDDDDDEPYTPWDFVLGDKAEKGEDNDKRVEETGIVEPNTSKMPLESMSKDDDDDEPYSPIDTDELDKDEEDKDVVIILDTGSSQKNKDSPEESMPSAQQLLAQLNTQIQREKQEIESIAVAIKRNETITHIPGLDGEML